MESVRCASTMGCGIGQEVDNLHLLDDRAGPSVRNDQRQRILVFGTDVLRKYIFTNFFAIPSTT